MPYISGALLTKYREGVVLTNVVKPSSGTARLGTTVIKYKSAAVQQAQIESTTTKVGPTVRIYAPELALILGTEDF